MRAYQAAPAQPGGDGGQHEMQRLRGAAQREDRDHVAEP